MSANRNRCQNGSLSSGKRRRRWLADRRCSRRHQVAWHGAVLEWTESLETAVVSSSRAAGQMYSCDHVCRIVHKPHQSRGACTVSFVAGRDHTVFAAWTDIGGLETHMPSRTCLDAYEIAAADGTSQQDNLAMEYAERLLLNVIDLIGGPYRAQCHIRTSSYQPLDDRGLISTTRAGLPMGRGSLVRQG